MNGLYVQAGNLYEAATFVQQNFEKPYVYRLLYENTVIYVGMSKGGVGNRIKLYLDMGLGARQEKGDLNLIDFMAEHHSKITVEICFVENVKIAYEQENREIEHLEPRYNRYCNQTYLKLKRNHK